MDNQTAHDAATYMKRSSKYNRRVKVVGLTTSRGKTVIQCVHKKTDRPFTVSKNDKAHLEEKIKQAEDLSAKPELLTRRGVPQPRKSTPKES